MIVVNKWPQCHVAILLCHVASNQKYNKPTIKGSIYSSGGNERFSGYIMKHYQGSLFIISLCLQ